MIAVVIPTIREDCLLKFKDAWWGLLMRHDVEFVVVHDGDKPVLEHAGDLYTVKDVMGKSSDLIYNKNDGVRNLGFAFVARYLPEVEYIITLDDDVKPIGDPIQDHIDALNMRVSTKWMSTILDEYPRGFPYGVRDKSEVVLSHGVWEGVKDWDAPTQLVRGNPDARFYKGVIPRGVMYPMCGMNIAFKRKMLPHMYYAPMGYRVDLDRFADIWLGIESKKIIDTNNLAVVSGYSKVLHEKASDVWKNLQKEARGLYLNENYGDDEYFILYEKERKRWYNLISPLI